MKPKFFGQFLVEKGYITQSQLLDALEHQQNHIVRLGEVAIKNGYMTTAQVETVNHEQRRTDKFFGELALDMGFLTREQLDKTITIQKYSHIFLGEILIEKGILTHDQTIKYLFEFQEDQKPIASLEDVVPDLHEMRKELMVILDTTIKIFRRMSNIHLKIGKGYFKSANLENLYLISRMYFMGSLNFKYFLNLPPDIAESIAKSLYLNKDRNYDNRVIADAVGELVNVICGNASSQLLEMGHRLTISTPESLLKKDTASIPVHGERHTLVFPGTVPMGYMDIGLVWSSDELPGWNNVKEKSHTVLIVDDSEFCRQQLKGIVESIPNFKVSALVNSGAQAIELYKLLQPDIVIIDLIIFDVSGEEVIKKIKEIEPSAKIIVITGMGESAEVILQKMKLGVLAVISKPIDENAVVNMLKKAIEEN